MVLPDLIIRIQEARIAEDRRRRRRQRRDEIGFNICFAGLIVCGIAELILAGIRIATGQ